MENNELNQVKIVDVKMPFLSMVVFMVKAAIASIPAIIVLVIFLMVLRRILNVTGSF